MTLSDLLTVAPWLLLGGVALWGLDRFGYGWRWAHAVIIRDAELRHSVTQAAAVRRRWPRLARHLGLVLADRTHTPIGAATPGNVAAAQNAEKVRYQVPKLHVRPDPYGLLVDLHTVPGVGLIEVQKHAAHLSDAWRCVRVAVTQPEPGRVRIRAVRRDPLIERTTYEHTPITADQDIRTIHFGTDEYAAPVDIRLDGVPGIGIYGLPGYGKTSAVLGLISRLADHPGVQFVLLDGKVEDPAHGDYAPVLDRFAIALGDDLEDANLLLNELTAYRRHRSAAIRSTLGTTNMWHVGPSADWPLIVLIIDEAHTFFAQVKDGGDKEIKYRNSLAAQNAQLTEDLVKKSRSVGFVTVLLTQKGTGDAIPTAIRDVCPVSLAFACRTIDAAVAALGDDIRQHPDANPVNLMDPAYIGVASMIVQGRPGYTRVRVPYVSETVAAGIATDTRQLVPASRRDLLSTRTLIRKQLDADAMQTLAVEAGYQGEEE